MELWEVFFLPTPAFELGTSGYLVLHSSTAPQQLLRFYLWQFQVYNSGAEGFVVVLFWLDLWEIFFLATLRFELGNYGSLVLHSTTGPWWLQWFSPLTISGILFWCRGIGGGVVLIGPVRDFHLWPHQDLNWGPLDLYSCPLPLYQSNFWFSPLTISGI